MYAFEQLYVYVERIRQTRYVFKLYALKILSLNVQKSFV